MPKVSVRQMIEKRKENKSNKFKSMLGAVKSMVKARAVRKKK